MSSIKSIKINRNFISKLIYTNLSLHNEYEGALLINECDYKCKDKDCRECLIDEILKDIGIE